MPIQTSRLQLGPRVIRPVADPLGLFTDRARGKPEELSLQLPRFGLLRAAPMGRQRVLICGSIKTARALSKTWSASRLILPA